MATILRIALMLDVLIMVFRRAAALEQFGTLKRIMFVRRIK